MITSLGTLDELAPINRLDTLCRCYGDEKQLWGCSETKPMFVASVTARFPLLTLFTLLLLLLALAAPAIGLESLRPQLNSDFESLQVRF